MKEKATYGNQHTGKIRWGRAVVCAVAGCLAFGISADVDAEARIPIVGWGAFSQKDATAERYAEAREAGFTHLTQMCETPADAKRLLSLAEKAGIKLAVGVGRSMSGTNAVMRMTANAEALVAAVKDSPALGFYYIVDEPNIAMAESIRDCVARYDALDPAHPCYVNLYGVPRDEKHARIFTGCATYREYLDRLYGTVPLKMVSFDVYPVLSVKPLEKGGRLGGAPVTLKERWYETLEIASSFARRRKVPMYAFALATSHGRYPVPTKAHLRLQMYSNLAYGAQLLQYFRYRAVAPWAKRSALFEPIREINQEIQARADVFLGAEVRGVWLKNGGRDYIVVVNRDPNYEMSFTAKFAPGSELVRRDGIRVRADAYEGLFWLEPGDAAVFAAPEEQGTHFVPPKGTSNVAVATVARPGAFRLKEDVLSHGVPDLFIVEAVVNDDQNGHFTQEHSIRGMEGTVRHVLARNPYPLL